jgi:hypothetical protein
VFDFFRYGTPESGNNAAKAQERPNCPREPLRPIASPATILETAAGSI